MRAISRHSAACARYSCNFFKRPFPTGLVTFVANYVAGDPFPRLDHMFEHNTVRRIPHTLHQFPAVFSFFSRLFGGECFGCVLSHFQPAAAAPRQRGEEFRKRHKGASGKFPDAIDLENYNYLTYSLH